MSAYSVAALIGVACAAGIVAEASAQAQSPPLTRADAIARALGDDPRLGAADAARRAAEARVRQAGRLPNPALDIVVENVEGSGPYQAWERGEATYSLTQRLELGGDRSARRRLAERDLDAARLGADIERLDLIEEVEASYIDAQAAEAARLVAEERLAVAQELADAARRRVAAARDPLMAGSRAQARLAEAQIDADAARLAALAARARLASYWGGGDDFSIDIASFERIGGATPRLDEDAGLRGRLADAATLHQGPSPDLALADLDRARADAGVAVERARSIPDPDVQLGWRSFNESDETAFVFGFSVPLQLWDRNTDGVAQARAESARAGFEASARARAIARERAMLAVQVETARAEVEALDASVLPNVEAALQSAREGYAMGAFAYLDVLEAQRALTDARMRRISALRSYHRADAALARIAGARAERAPSEENSR